MSDLPSGWEWARLEELAAPMARAMTDGPFGSNLKSAHYVESGPRVIRLQNIGFGEFIDERAHISEEHFQKLRHHEARAGDLVVASLGQDLPRACLVPPSVGPAIVKADCIRVRLHPHVDARYVNYALQRPALRHAVADQIHGVGRPRLGMTGIRQLAIPLPPRVEQERIVAAVEEHLSRLDAAEVAFRSAASRVDRLLPAARANAFAQPWPMRPLRSVADTQLGKMLSAKSKTGVGSTPYLRNKNVRWGSVDVTDLAFMDFTDEELQKFRLLEGDVLICEGGAGVGRTAIWRGELELCCYQKALHRVRVSPELLPEFLLQYLRYLVESRRLEQQLSGVAIGHFPQEDLRALEIPVPPMDDQRRMLGVIDLQESLADALIAALVSATARAAALRRSIFSAAFSGRFVLQDPDDEPASVLLDRIRAERGAVAPTKRTQKVRTS